METILAHDRAGSGEPLVLLHAFPLARGFWKPQSEFFSRKLQVIAPDLPGLGRSPRQRSPSIPAMAQAVIALLDALKITQPVLLAGLSMGGYVAFECVRQFPQRIRGLMLCSTHANTDGPEQRRARLEAAERLRQSGDLSLLAGQMMPKLLGKTSLSMRPKVVETVRALILANDPQGVADAQLAMADRRDSLHILPEIKCPALVVVGDEEVLIPLEDANAMSRGLPDARLEFIPKAGHLLSLEEPDAFNDRAARFLVERFGIRV